MMNDNEVTRFRNKRASEIKLVIQALESTFGSKSGVKNIKTTPLDNAATSLKNGMIGNKVLEKGCWGYEIVNFKMPVETLRHIRPKGVKNVELTLNMSLEAFCSDWGTLNDPLKSLSFSVELRGLSSKNNYFCFHIDKHDMNKFSEEPHPIYHVQYSPKPKCKNDDDFDYGDVLHFDTPRLMHHPLDLILGIGFLISNFYPSKWEVLIKNRFFANAYKECQQNIIRPYNHFFANHWKPIDVNTIVKPEEINHICPYVI